MEQILNQASIYFSAGTVGGLANALIIWVFGVIGIPKALGVGIAPQFNPGYLYPKLVWGGIWGMVFFIPNMPTNIYILALIASLFPTLVQLFLVFPFKAKKGFLGLELGILTPIFVIFYNFIWGLAAIGFIKMAQTGISTSL